jgi:hypothetical protein
MNSSKDALKRKVDDLHEQAEEIEELGVKLLEEAPFFEGNTFRRLEVLDYHSPSKKVQREAILKYQQWYVTALKLVENYIPEWQDSFKSGYTKGGIDNGVMDYLKLGKYTNYESIGQIVADLVNELENQLSILLSIPPVVEVKEIGLRKLITADVARTEIEQAEILLDSGFERAAGSLTGVALELHLKTQCDINGISYPLKPTIEPLLQALYNAKKLDITEQKHLQYLGSIRNKCSHSEDVTEKEVKRVIKEVKKLI